MSTTTLPKYNADELLKIVKDQPGSIWVVHATSRTRAKNLLNKDEAVTTWTADGNDKDLSDRSRTFSYASELGRELAREKDINLIVVRWPGNILFGSDRYLFSGEVILNDHESLVEIKSWPNSLQTTAANFYYSDEAQTLETDLHQSELLSAILGPIVTSFTYAIHGSVILASSHNVELNTGEVFPEFTLACWAILPDNQLSHVQTLTNHQDSVFINTNANDFRNKSRGVLPVARNEILLETLLRATEHVWRPTLVAFGVGATFTANRKRIYISNLCTVSPIIAWLCEALHHHREALRHLSADKISEDCRISLLRVTAPTIENWANFIKTAISSIDQKEFAKISNSYETFFKKLPSLKSEYEKWRKKRGHSDTSGIRKIFLNREKSIKKVSNTKTRQNNQIFWLRPF